MSSAAKDAPFFCYLAYNAVHGPLRVDESKPASAPEAWVNKALDRGVSFLRSDYVGILEHMDHNIGRLVDLLDELDVADFSVPSFAGRPQTESRHFYAYRCNCHECQGGVEYYMGDDGKLHTMREIVDGEDQEAGRPRMLERRRRR